MISVFYDGKCGMCRREIAHYQKIAEAGKFQWVDIARDKDALISFNIAQAEALLYLHALDQSNRVHVGIDAFVLIWNNLPRWWILGLIFRNSVLKKFAISSNCISGPKEILSNGKGGALFKVGNYKELAKLIIFYNKNLNARNKKINFASKNIHRFDYKKNLNSYLNVITNN